MTPEDLDNRFDYHAPVTAERQRAHAAVRTGCRQMAEMLDNLLPDGREKSLAVTNLEQVMFWANAAIARARDTD